MCTILCTSFEGIRSHILHTQVRLPDRVGFGAAAAIMYPGLAAHYLACTTFPLEAGHTCLVHAAAGGTGQLLTQVCDVASHSITITIMRIVVLLADTLYASCVCRSPSYVGHVCWPPVRPKKRQKSLAAVAPVNRAFR